ncbi:MAG: bifunctional oligoribonuclease/PAP phosphatase NrnA [Acidobacteriota bacterium]
MTANRAPEALLERLRSGHRFLITSHINPDGDAIGSSLGLARVLRAAGKVAQVWTRDAPPRIYRALPDSDSIHVGTEPPTGFPGDFDAAVVLECPSLDRCGLDALPKLPLLNIDHHLGNHMYGEVDWVDTAAPAVGAMVFRLAKALGVTVDPDTADALYLTLVTDTGGFRFSNTTVEAFESAADLVRAGATPARVSHWLFESQPESVLRLLGEMLQSLELHDGGRVATARLTRGMVERAGAQPGDSEGLIDYPRSIAGVDAVALFRDLEDGRIKVSLRSRGTVDVERVARSHGGGGHKNAAGFTAELQDPSTLRAATVQALIDALG